MRGEFKTFMAWLKCRSCCCSRLIPLGKELPWGQAACCFDCSSVSCEVLLLIKYHLVNVVIPRGMVMMWRRSYCSSMVSDFFFSPPKKMTSLLKPAVWHGPALGIKCSDEPQLLELFCCCKLLLDTWAAGNPHGKAKPLCQAVTGGCSVFSVHPNLLPSHDVLKWSHMLEMFLSVIFSVLGKQLQHLLSLQMENIWLQER